MPPKIKLIALVILLCASPACNLPTRAGTPGAAPPTIVALSANPTPAPPAALSSVAKIEAAEQAGTLDHDTALLYKLYAALDANSLPDEYQSDSSTGGPEATQILAQISRRLDQLPAGVRAKVEPFFKRPTDPQSFWYQGVTAWRPSGRAPGLASLSSETTFAYVDAKNTPVRVWYAVSSGGQDRGIAAQLAAEIDSSRMWTKESEAMLGYTVVA